MSVVKPVKKKKPKYMLVEIDWNIKDIKSAAFAKNVSVAKFAQLQVKAAVERHITRQLRLISE